MFRALMIPVLTIPSPTIRSGLLCMRIARALISRIEMISNRNGVLQPL